jgi:DNA-binding MarR family transcriptional regulator
MTEPDRKMLDEIADTLMESFPIFFRRIFRDESQQSMRKFDPSRHVLRIVMMHGPVPMSQMGRHMGISKPYMTALVNKLIREGLVERVSDPEDRRVVKITITTAGKDAVKELKKCQREAVLKNISSLSPEDISVLHDSVKNIRSIISKLDREGSGESKSRKRCEDA